MRISGSDSTVLITADSVDAVLSAVHLSDDTVLVKLRPRGGPTGAVDWEAASRRRDQVETVVLAPHSSAATEERDDEAWASTPAVDEAGRPLRRPWAARLLELAAETWLVVRLALLLYSYLGFGWRWSRRFAQLVAFSLLLLPGFIQVAAFYLLSPRVVRGVRYGPAPRNYRNFPQGAVPEMLEDVNAGVGYVLRRAVLYGGDPARVFLVGQSCGAHLLSLAALTQAEQRAGGSALPGGLPAWDVGAVRGMACVSGVYNVHDLEDYLHGRGLYRSLLRRIMSIGGKPQLKLLSPCYLAAHALGGKRAASGASLAELRLERHASGGSNVGRNLRLSTAWSATSLASLSMAGDDATGLVGDAEDAPGGAQPAAGCCKPGPWRDDGVEVEDAPTEAGTTARPSPGELMPPVLLIHGTADRCVPAGIARQYGTALQRYGLAVQLVLYEGETHTSPLLENAMRGGKDQLTSDILSMVEGRPVEVRHRRLCPEPLIALARWVCPF